MVDDQQLLHCITESADMGLSSLKHVKGRTDDRGLDQALDIQIVEYQRDYEDAVNLLGKLGLKPKRTGFMPKMYANMTADVKTATSNDRPSTIAEMVIQGSTMGVTEIVKNLNDYVGDDASVKCLAERHLQTEQANIDAMKAFL